LSRFYQSDRRYARTRSLAKVFQLHGSKVTGLGLKITVHGLKFTGHGLKITRHGLKIPGLDLKIHRT
jgi:hypothetical protein